MEDIEEVSEDETEEIISEDETEDIILMKKIKIIILNLNVYFKINFSIHIYNINML